ncbi:MAG: hypothetical protein KGJ37_06950, partial [Verrucomicrobiota bacterium]|nr:hypothetical protein [Verrucomicrobiota bacterium]
EKKSGSRAQIPFAQARFCAKRWLKLIMPRDAFALRRKVEPGVGCFIIAQRGLGPRRNHSPTALLPGGLTICLAAMRAFSW